MREFIKSSNSGEDSAFSTMQLESWSWRRAFCEEAFLPPSVTGPVDFFALARLAWICFSVAIVLVGGGVRSEGMIYPRVAREAVESR